jgi:excinuclease UvrABC helicase subunit UvrB
MKIKNLTRLLNVKKKFLKKSNSNTKWRRNNQEKFNSKENIRPKMGPRVQIYDKYE